MPAAKAPIERAAMTRNGGFEVMRARYGSCIMSGEAKPWAMKMAQTQLAESRIAIVFFAPVSSKKAAQMGRAHMMMFLPRSMYRQWLLREWRGGMAGGMRTFGGVAAGRERTAAQESSAGRADSSRHVQELGGFLDVGESAGYDLVKGWERPLEDGGDDDRKQQERREEQRVVEQDEHHEKRSECADVGPALMSGCQEDQFSFSLNSLSLGDVQAG